MDYGKSGAAKMAKNTPRHKEHNEPGSDKNPFGKRPSKAELLERMKKAQAAAGKGLDKPADPADDTATDEAGGKPMRQRDDHN